MIGSILPNSILLLATLQTLNLAQNLGGLAGKLIDGTFPNNIEFSRVVRGSLGNKILLADDNLVAPHTEDPNPAPSMMPEYFNESEFPDEVLSIEVNCDQVVPFHI